MKMKGEHYHFHTEGAVVGGLVLNVDVHQRTRFTAAVTGAKSGRYESLVTHGCRGSPAHLQKPTRHTHKDDFNHQDYMLEGFLFSALTTCLVLRLCVWSCTEDKQLVIYSSLILL